MRHTFAVLATLLSLSTPVVADGPVVVELYTSQGCSSCPPADKMLKELAQRTDVIPLALHVDYWDYIGWEDSFGSAEHTARQQNYARVAGANTIYTPQMVIGGQDHVVGTKPMDVADLIRTHANATTGVSIEVQRSGGQLRIVGATSRRLPAGTMVQVVRYLPLETVDIRRGENAGRALEYANIVVSWDVVGDWSGSGALDMTVAVSGTGPLAVIIQEPGPGAILASGVLR